MLNEVPRLREAALGLRKGAARDSRWSATLAKVELHHHSGAGTPYTLDAIELHSRQVWVTDY